MKFALNHGLCYFILRTRSRRWLTNREGVYRDFIAGSPMPP